jgi:sugar transferase (PEP-CTERM/EpsH1 system associated)
MKILLTLRDPLFPADTGGKIRSLNIFRRLASRAEIHAVALAPTDAAAVPEMMSIFRSYTPVFWREAKAQSPGFYKDLLLSQFNSLPYFLDKCNLPCFESAVKQLLTRERFDLLFCDFLHTAAPLLNIRFRPRVVFEHNIEFLLRKRKWEIEAHPLQKFVFGTEWRKTQAIEAKVCRAFDHVITVSEEEQQIVRQQFGVEQASTLPAGVDTDFFQSRDVRPQPGHLVFVGSMDWYPNEDGVIWFLRDVYPQIRKRIPNVSFSVVGRNPSSQLRVLAAQYPSVEVTGRVSDVRPYLSQAEVVVVPLRVGGGTRIKIPEAMAMGKPIVSTPIGAEGLPFCDGRELLLAEDRELFVDKTVDLLNNATQRETMGRTARNEVVNNHSWTSVVETLESILERVKSSKVQATAA